MPSYAVAPEAPPARAPEPQPPRVLAKRKNAPGGGRPPNPMCCGRLTKRISPGSSTVMCTLCQTVYPHGSAPEQKPERPAIPPPPPPPANVLVNEATQIARPKPTAAPSRPMPTPPRRPIYGTGLTEKQRKLIDAELAEVPPGLNGDHETHREESKKIPPSRPANNSRGDGEFTVHHTPPPMPQAMTKRGRLRVAIEALGPYPAHIRLPADSETSRLVRDLINDMRRRNGMSDLTHYIAEDRSCHVICRKAEKGGVSR